MKPHVKPGIAVLVALLVTAGVAGCGGSPSSPSASSSAQGSGSSAPGSPSGGIGSPSGSPSGSSSGAEVTIAPGEPAASVVEYRVSYDWGVPSNDVEIWHTVVPPIAPPPAPPVPYVTGIYAADHPEGRPSFQRISFYFRGGYPGYRFSFVPAVVKDAEGSPISLQGNAFLRMVFVSAQAHDESGRSTILASPPPSLGFSALKSYGPAGDFEARVTYGLGIQVAPNSDQVRRIRVGELKRADAPNSYVYVVFVDVES